MRHRRTKSAALAIATGLLTTACTTTADVYDAPAGVQDGLTPEAAATPIATAAQQGALDEFTARISGVPAPGATTAEIQTESDRQHRAREEYIAACMAEQGFTYIPNVAAPPAVRYLAGPRLGTREFAERFGFGVAADFRGGQDATVQRDLTVSAENLELLAAMSQVEREAWNEAYFGMLLTPVEPGTIRDAASFGCVERGLQVVAGWFQTDIPEFSAIATEVGRFREAVAVHPHTLALNAEWANCMAAAGFGRLANPFQLESALWTEWTLLSDWSRLEEIIAGWDWAALPDGPPGWTVDEDGVGTLVLDADAAASFQDREFALALADVDCREALDFDARALVINHQLQREFVDANRNELEAWATFVENRRAGR